MSDFSGVIMRPYLDKIIEEQGIEGAIAFLQSVGDNGIHLSKHETDALAKLLCELKDIAQQIIEI